MKEKIMFAIVWISLIAVLYNSAVGNVNKFNDVMSAKGSKSVKTNKSSSSVPDCSDKRVLETLEKLASDHLLKEIGHAAYVGKIHSVKNLGLNPKTKVRLCQTRVDVYRVEKKGQYVTFLVHYNTDSRKVNIDSNWAPL